MRKTILIVLGILSIVLAIFGAKKIISSNKKSKPIQSKTLKTVFVEKVVNSTIPIHIAANGTLIAKRKIALFSEVQGVFKLGQTLFKPGQTYAKNDVLITINNLEFEASVQASKSDFFNLVMSVMPDLKIDFSSDFDKWQSYLQRIDLSKPLPKLPEFSSKKEQYFIAGKNIISSYYQVKNLEERLSKYQITAPFNGVLSSSLVTEGTLIRTGQNLGEFIDPTNYELEVAIGSQFSHLLKIGKKVVLQSIDKKSSYTGKVSRINSIVDKNTQTITAFIDVQHSHLKEGMFLEATLDVKEEKNAYLISRNLLVNNKKIYVVKDSVLEFMNVTPVFFYDKKVVVKGIPNGTLAISKPTAGAFEGMPVTIYTPEK